MTADTPVAFSKSIKTNVRIAWLAGLTSAFSILVYVHFSTIKFHLQNSHTSLLLLDALFTALLAYGVFKFSRIAAILLPILFITNEVVIWGRVPLVNEALMSYVLLFAFILGIVGTIQYQRYLTHLSSGTRLSVSRDGFISPHYALGVEIVNDATTPDEFLEYIIKKHFDMRPARAKLAQQLCRTHGSVILPLESQQQIDQVIAAIAAEAKQRNYPLACKAVSTQQSVTGVDNVVTRSHVEGAKRLIASMKWTYATPHTLVPVSEGEIPHLDLAGYRQFRTHMEAEGFRYLGDIEIPELSHSPYTHLARTMTRYMLSAQGDTIAAYYQTRPLLSQLFTTLARGLRNGRIIAAPRHFLVSLKTRHIMDFITEFTDGRILSTNNASPASHLSKPKTYDSNAFPAGTPLPTLLQAHRQRLADYLRNETTHAQAVIMHSLTDITNSYQRTKAQIAAYRKDINWITEAELQRLSRGKPKLASALYAEVQKLLNDEQSPP